jgi:phytoene dehydrogenase-like protein
MKINLAVAELPRVHGVDGDGGGVQPYHRGLIQISKPLADLDVDQAPAQAGEPAEAAHMELCIPTVHDASLAPEGTHVVTIGVRPVCDQHGGLDDVKGGRGRPRGRAPWDVRPEPPGVDPDRGLDAARSERDCRSQEGITCTGDMSPDQLLSPCADTRITAPGRLVVPSVEAGTHWRRDRRERTELCTKCSTT